MAFSGRVGIEIDTTAFQSSIGPSFMELRRELEGYGRERAHRIADIARVLAPRLKEPDPRYYPGELADSIEVIEISDHEWEVAAWARWAGFQEFGTAKMRSSP